VVKLPYVRSLGQREGVSLWLVDGRWIRNHRDIEFTNGAHHYSRAYVPQSEVWIDREAPGAHELEFNIQHQLVERGLMARGIRYEQALLRASRVERAMRRLSRNGDGLLAAPDPRPLLRRRLLRPPRWLGPVGESVWLVRGRDVRDAYHPDFTEGGHGLRYPFIPRREIWIDDALRVSERGAVIVHEVVELRLMRRGLSYDQAHPHASAAETEVRAGRTPEVAVALVATG
jgi:hypothetical protein